MKKILLGLALLTSVNTFSHNSASTDHNNMSLDSIYNRGYSIEVTVNQDRGLAFSKGEMYYQHKITCLIELRTAVTKNSILKKGRKFILDASWQNGTRKTISTSTDSAIRLLETSLDDRPLKTFGDLKKACQLFNFKIIVNSNLEEI